jgi:hypothetical protein
MLHSTLQNMLDEMLANPDEMFVSSNSKHCALYSTHDDAILFLEGDFSGSPRGVRGRSPPDPRRYSRLHKAVIAT